MSNNFDTLSDDAINKYHNVYTKIKNHKTKKKNNIKNIKNMNIKQLIKCKQNEHKKKNE